MRKSHAGLAIGVALALIVPAPAVASWTPQWFVELEGAPAAEGTSDATLDAEHRHFASEANRAGIDYRERFAYRTLFNGVSVAADDSEIAELRELDGVAAVYPVGTATLDQTAPAFDPELAFAITMTGVDVAQSRLGFTGRGVHVAVIDSGIDYDHPDLGGCFGPGCRVTNGYDFVGDDYDDEESDLAWQPVPHPDPFPDDCAGHGTHVAGIIGAAGAIRGVAPEATFGAYRVFGCSGSASTDLILAALERVYRDGADVLNLSIAESLNSWPGTPVARAASRLVDKGIVVVGAAGNDRLQGLWGAGAPSVGEHVIATASVDNIAQQVPAFALSPDARPIRYAAGTGSVPIPSAGTLEFAVADPPDACAPLAPGSLSGKVALVRRGTCTFGVKSANVAGSGAAAVVFYNNAGGIDGAPVVTGLPIPAVYIGQEDGELIVSRLASGAVTLTWGALASAPIANGGRLSPFSSVGLAADLSLKPDIAAPGGSIRSTWPVERGRYAVLSGTSMAAPHVAGASALYLQAHPRTRARDVGPILQNSADPVPWSRDPASGRVESVVGQGAGLLDIDDAILATTTIAPGKLSLGDAAGSTQTLTIANDGPRTVTYTLANVDAPAVVGRDVLQEHAEAGVSAVTFAQAWRPVGAVTVRAGGRARLDVRIAPDPALSEGALYGGYLVFTPDDGGAPLRVPYAGYKGDYQAVPALTPTSKGYPWLARRTGLTFDGHIRPTYEKVGAGGAFTLAPTTLTTTPPSALTRAGTDAPIVLVHFNHDAQRVRVEAFSARGHRRLGEAFAAQLIPRNGVENLINATSVLTTALPLDGTIRQGHRRVRLPDGEYYVVMTVERALAERGTPVETWTSPTFRIDRP